MEPGDHKFSLFAKLKRFRGLFVGFLSEDIDESGKIGSFDVIVFEVLGGLVLPLKRGFKLLKHFGLAFESFVESSGVL